jgi:hypothetical protein
MNPTLIEAYFDQIPVPDVSSFLENSKPDLPTTSNYLKHERDRIKNPNILCTTSRLRSGEMNARAG